MHFTLFYDVSLKLETTAQVLRAQLSLFDVGTNSCGKGGKWAGRGKCKCFRRWSSLVLHSSAGPKPSGTKQRTVATEWLSKHGCQSQGFSRLSEAPGTGLGRVRSRVCPVGMSFFLPNRLWEQLEYTEGCSKEGEIQFTSRNNFTTRKTQQLSFHCVFPTKTR